MNKSVHHHSQGVMRRLWPLLLLAILAGCTFRATETKAIDGLAGKLANVIEADGRGIKHIYRIASDDSALIIRLENAQSLGDWRTLLRAEEVPDEDPRQPSQARQNSDVLDTLKKRAAADKASTLLAQEITKKDVPKDWQVDYLADIKAVNSLLAARRPLVNKYSKIESEYWDLVKESRKALGRLQWRMNTTFELKDPQAIRKYAHAEVLPTVRQAQEQMPEVKRLRQKIEAYNSKIMSKIEHANDLYKENTGRENALSSIYKL